MEQQEREKARSEGQEQLRSVVSSPDRKEDGGSRPQGEDNDENIDPTMLQYMKLISQKRDTEKVEYKENMIFKWIVYFLCLLGGGEDDRSTCSKGTR